jgi:hypothetical protein
VPSHNINAAAAVAAVAWGNAVTNSLSYGTACNIVKAQVVDGCIISILILKALVTECTTFFNIPQL